MNWTKEEFEKIKPMYQFLCNRMGYEPGEWDDVRAGTWHNVNLVELLRVIRDIPAPTSRGDEAVDEANKKFIDIARAEGIRRASQHNFNQAEAGYNAKWFVRGADFGRVWAIANSQQTSTLQAENVRLREYLKSIELITWALDKSVERDLIRNTAEAALKGKG